MYPALKSVAPQFKRDQASIQLPWEQPTKFKTESDREPKKKDVNFSEEQT